MESIAIRLDEVFGRARTEIPDAGFSKVVMRRLPRSRRNRKTARGWTLGGGAVVGCFATSVLGAPIETAFSSFVSGNGNELSSLALPLLVSLLAVPAAWVFYSK